MKKIQKIRMLSQVIFLILTVMTVMTEFKQIFPVILFFTIVGGAFYCSWVCPFGFIQDIMSKIGDILRIKKIKPSKGVQKYLKYSRLLLALATVLITSDFIFILFSKDPRVNFDLFLSRGIFTTSAFVIIGIFALSSLFFDRFFCNYVCVQGAKYGLIALLRPITIKRDEDKCVNCKKCDKICPMNIEVSSCKNLRSISCVNCFNCVSSCPVDNTLSYGLTNWKKENKKLYFTIVGVAVIAVVLAINNKKLNVDSHIDSSNQNINEMSNSNNDLTAEGSHPEVVSNEKAISEAVTHLEEEHAEERRTGTGEDRPRRGDRKARRGHHGHHGAASQEELYNSVVMTATGLKDGNYQGSANGFRGKIDLTVTVNSGKIANINIDSHSDDYGWFRRAINIVEDIISKQDTEVDLIAGATYSSAGIRNAVNSALESAK